MSSISSLSVYLSTCLYIYLSIYYLSKHLSIYFYRDKRINAYNNRYLFSSLIYLYQYIYLASRGNGLLATHHRLKGQSRILALRQSAAIAYAPKFAFAFLYLSARLSGLSFNTRREIHLGMYARMAPTWVCTSEWNYGVLLLKRERMSDCSVLRVQEGNPRPVPYCIRCKVQ